MDITTFYERDQFINWTPTLRPGDPKPAKVPTANGVPIDPHIPAQWVPYDEAVRRDPDHVGFVLTANDPYFCIDLDHCLIDGVCSSLALEACTMFAGAYVEISYSRDGLHIIGRGTPPPGFSTRGPGVELYTEKRFIAITGDAFNG